MCSDKWILTRTLLPMGLNCWASVQNGVKGEILQESVSRNYGQKKCKKYFI